MENYNRLVELENEYNENEPSNLSMALYVIGGICTALGTSAILGILCIPLLVGGIAILVYRWRLGKAEIETNTARAERRAKILEEARSLL